MQVIPPNPDDLPRDTRLAGEALAWLDEKDWTDEDKVCVTAAVFPVLLVRMSDDKATLDQAFDYFTALMKGVYEVAWKQKLAQRTEVHGICQGCKMSVAPGFYTCKGDGSHSAI